jgi:2-polyprenyl-3-methyl-5-hydroxy-6-metoxy-1,4-benzoquinol methylase
MWEGISRFTGGWFNNLLVQEWLPSLPDVRAKLEAGVDVADIGSGYGQALIKLATTYPRSRFTGYEVLASSVERASAAAVAAGVAHRVQFVKADVNEGLPEKYDVITTFDVVHDAVDPSGLLKAIRAALKPDGIYVCLEINCQPRLEDNIGPLGALLLSCSVMFCLTVSLARDGEGLGTMGLHEEKVREMAAEAGFGSVRRVPMDNPFNILYEIKPTIQGL